MVVKLILLCKVELWTEVILCKDAVEVIPTLYEVSLNIVAE